jgi:scyllo-inositol 2-dehydrogenase (NADP+)
MIRVGLVGFGLAGRVFHAPMITAVDGLELAAVVERSARHAQAAYPGIVTYPSIEAMLSDKTLELVVVATPDNWHAAQAQEALKAGRHVVVDKPVAATSAEIADLIAISSAADRFLIPFHNRRWDSDFRTLQKLLLEQKLGRIVSLESTFDRWRPHPKLAAWREDGSITGGTLLDLGTHLVDQGLVLFGLPEAVGAEVSTERDGSLTIDSFTVRLYYPRQVINLSANCLAAQPRPRYRVRGTQGNFVKWGLDPQEARLREVQKVIEPGWGLEPASVWGTVAVEPEEQAPGPKDPTTSMVTYPRKPVPGDYRLFYTGVRDSILGKTRPPVLAMDAWRVARVLEMAIESSASRSAIICDWTREPGNLG